MAGGDILLPPFQAGECLPESEIMLLSDAQTSGGLLLSMPNKQLASFEEQMSGLHEPYWIIGQVIGGHSSIEVI